MSSELAIGDVARLVGLGVHALRFYEKEELFVGPIRRTSGGQRRYGDVDVGWLRICVRLRESGMPLRDLKRFAALVREGPGNESERLALLDAHRTRVEAQIAALQECRDIITWKTEVYAGHIAAGDAAGLWDPTAVPTPASTPPPLPRRSNPDPRPAALNHESSASGR